MKYTQACPHAFGILGAIGCLLALCLAASAQPASTWTDGSGDHRWDNPANWSPAGVPSFEATVVINSGSPNATALGEFSVHRLDLNGGTLTANGLILAQLNQSGGSLAGANAVASGGAWEWKSGSVYGLVTVGEEATATFSGSADKLFGDGAELRNHGTITWTGGRLYGRCYNGPATLRNATGARFIVNGGTGWARQHGNREAQFILEAGSQLVKEGPADIGSNWRLDNHGTLAVNGGVLRWGAGGVSAGVFTNQAGATLVFSDGTHTLAEGTRLGGEGNFQVTEGTVTASGAVTHGAPDSAGTFTVAGGILNGSGFVGVGRFGWTSGWLGGVVTLTDSATATFSGTADKWFQDGAELRNHGTITWTGGRLYGRCYSGTATLHNAPGARFVVAGGTGWARQYGNRDGRFILEAGSQLVKEGPADISSNWRLDNHGTLAVNGGVLRWGAGGVSAGVFTNQAGATLVFSDGTHTLAEGTRLGGEGNFQVTEGTVTASGAVTHGAPDSAGTFTVAGGILNGSGFVGVGRFGWTSGWLGGVVTLTDSATATFSGTADKWFQDGAELRNHGTITWTGGRLYGRCYSGTATLHNAPGARFVVAGGTGWARQYGNRDGRFILEAGSRLEKEGPADISSTWRLDNHGTLAVNSGVLRWGAGGASAGGFTNAAGATLVFSGGTHVLAEGTRLGGEGGFQVTAGTVTASGAVTHGAPDSAGTFTLAGGTLSGSGFVGTGRFDWTSGWLGGVVTLAEGATATFGSNADKWFADGAEFRNHGTITWTGGRLYGRCYSGPATIANEAGAIFHLAADGTPFTRQHGNHPFHFVNATGALLRKSSAGTVYLGNLWLNQQGELRVEAGTLELATPVTLADGGRITGMGLVRQTDSTVTLAGLLTLDGARFQVAGGTLAAGNGGRIATANDGLWEWSAGTLSGTLVLTNGAVSRLTGSGTKYLTDSAALHNHGTLTWSGGVVQGRCYNGPATLHNRVSGRLAISGGVLLNRQHGNQAATLINDGTLTLGTPGALVGGDWRFTQGAAGILDLHLAGTIPGTQFGRWATTGAAILDGTLRATFDGPFRPPTGSVFPCLAAGTLTGGFATKELPPLYPGLAWAVDQTNNTVTLRVTGEPGCLPPPAGLIAWWPGDGHPNDLVGTNPGTLHNGATATAAGAVRQAFAFDGTDDFFEAAPPFESATAFSFAFWLHVRSFPDPARVPVFALGTATNPRPAGNLVFQAAPGDAGFGVEGLWADGSGFDLRTVIPFDPGVWKHIVITYDGAVLRQYVDGGLLNEQPHAGRTLGGPLPIRIGGGPAWSAGEVTTAHLDGLVDEFGVYTRALPPGEIAALHVAGSTGMCRPADLALAIVAAPQPAIVGSNLVFTLTVTNAGPAEASNVTVTDPLPESVALVSAAASQGDCATAGQRVTGRLGTLAVGASAVLTITVTPSVTGPLTNTADVVAGEVDPDLANNAVACAVTIEPPEQRVLFVNVRGVYDPDGLNFHRTLGAVGASADFVDLAVNGQAATALTTAAYDQVWVFDLSSGSDDYPADWEAIATWFTNRTGRAIICDARSISSYWRGRWEDEGLRLTENYYENLKHAGGGLVLATDHGAFHQGGINRINDALGLQRFTGEFNLASIPVDTTSPLMTRPNNLGPTLSDDSSPGQAPFGLQPNGLILYSVAWHSGDTNTPGISCTLRGGVGFRIELALPGTGGEFLEEAPIIFRAQPQGGLAPFAYTWTSDRDGALGTEREFTLTTLSPGAHVVSLVATDSLGSADSASVAITVLPLKPVVSLDLQPASDSGRSNSDNLTTNTAPGIDVVINKRGALAVDLTGDGAWDETRTDLAAGTQVFAASGLPDGVHILAARFEPFRGEPVTNVVALTIDTRGPRVLAVSPAPGATLVAPPSQVELTFDTAIDPGTVNPADATLAGPDGPVAVTGVSALAADRFRFSFPVQRQNASYTFVVGPQVADLAGNLMDQDADGLNGSPERDRFTAAWTLTLPELLARGLSGPETAIAGQPVAVLSLVTNQGQSSAIAPWTQRLELWSSPDGGATRLLAQWTLTNNLSVGATLEGTNVVIIPPGLAGPFWLALKTDAGQQVPEADEGNNVSVAAAAMQLQAPDLEVTGLAASAAASFGATLPVTWIVSNTGTAEATSAWNDRLYLSTRSNTVAGATPLLTLVAPAPLAPGASYKNTQDVTLPLSASLPPGNYFVVAATDTSGVQSEANEANNLRAVPLTLALPPLPDLGVVDVILPSQAFPGQRIELLWTTTNLGTAGVSGAWREKLSTSNALQGLRVLAEFGFTNVVDPGQGVVRTQQVTLPADTLAGPLHLLVQTDNRAEVFEDDEANNVGQSVEPLVVPARLILALPSLQLREGTPAVVGTVSRNDDRSQEFAVTLINGDPSELEVPGELVIPAGQATATFNLRALTDGIVDGSQPVVLEAQAPGMVGAWQELTILDVDVPQLSLTVSAPVLAEGASVPATVERDHDTNVPLVVSLTGSSPGRLGVPETVTIPAGEWAAGFVLEARRDHLVLGPLDVTINAIAPGFAAGGATLTVLDGDLTDVTFSVTSETFSESAGPLATRGTVTRSPIGDRLLVIDLESSDSSEILLPPRVVIPAGAASATFLIAAVDDHDLDGPQTVTLTPWITASGTGNRLVAGHPANVTVTDDESPALRVTVARGLVAEGQGEATTGTVIRNTGTGGTLSVKLSSSDTSEATVPAEVSIPDGRNFANFPITSLNDATADGNQTLTLIAAAAGYTSGQATLVVSDTDLPDLVVEEVGVPGTAEAEAYFDISYRVANQGLGPAGPTWVTRVFLSDDPVVGGDTLLGEHTSNGTLPVGQFLGQTLRARAPQAVGHYWILVTTDVSDAVAETLEDNNTSIAATPLEVLAPYGAWVETDLEVAPAGTLVPLRGQALRAGGPPVPDALVHVHVTLRGATRVYAVMTDAVGEFEVDFPPLPTEAGRYSIGAVHPGVSEAPAQDTFDLLGFRTEPRRVTRTVPELGTVTGTVQLVNLGELPLTSLNATTVDQPANLTVELTPPGDGALPGSASVLLAYRVTARDASILAGMVIVRVSTAEGVAVTFPIYLTVEPLRARLTASPGQIEIGMVRGRQRMTGFGLVNAGAMPTGPITVSLPAVPWLQLASTNPLPSLAPGETNQLSLLLTPPEDLPLGVHSGALALTCASTSLAVPFEFRCLSEGRGDLRVTVVDEYTFYAEGAPLVTNATVSLTDALTRTALGSWPVDAQGTLQLTNLLESYYTLDVSAPDHTAYHATLFLEPGQSNEVEAYLPRQAVRYTWTVVPTEVEDRTRIVLETEFETFVPMPVVTIEPKEVDLTDVAGDVTQINFTISNHGLIAAVNTEFKMDPLNGWRFTPLLTWIGDLPAMTTLTVPVIAERVPSPGLAAHGAAPAVEGEDCYSLTWAIYEVVCRQYRSARADIAKILDRSKCPPRPAPPNPPNLHEVVGALYAWLGKGGGTSTVGEGWSPPTVPRKAEGAVSFVDVPPSQPPNSVPRQCDPCTWKIAAVLFGCVKDALVDMVNPLPDVAKCLKSSADSAISGTDALGAMGDIEGCLSSIGKSIPGLDKVIAALQCGRDLLNACKDKRVQQMAAAPAAAGEPASLALVAVQIERLEAFLGAWRSILDDEAWFQGTQGTNLVIWLDEFHTGILATSDGGTRISPGERAALLATTRPDGLGETNLIRLLDRWNRTVDYYEAGIRNLADLPAGWSADFVAWDAFLSAVTATRDAIEASYADGFTDPFAGLQDAARQVEFELAGQPAEGVCGRITLRLDQQAVISRDAFKATLEIENGTPVTLDQVGVEVIFMDADGQVVTDRFGIREPQLRQVTAVDGTGSIGADSTATAIWTLIPASDAAPTTATQYWVSGVLRYTQEGVEITVPLTAVEITVHPNPRVFVKYFHQRDVYADDPFTDTVEPSLPYSLAVMVENRGFGEARNLRISSAQPEIIENEKGLLIDFKIIASEVEGQPLTPSLTVNLGNIDPGARKIGRWLLTSTLQGLFTDYRATFEHLDALGNQKLSLIEEVTIHQLIRLVEAPGPFADDRPDFLVNGVVDPQDLPDTLYLSDGTTNTVTAVLEAAVDGPPADDHLQVELTAGLPAGWVYLRVPEPGAGTFTLRRVVRSDGRELAFRTNVWTTDRTFLGLGRKPVREHVLHLLDWDSPGGYTLHYEVPPAPDTTAPASLVSALPADSYPQIALSWSGQDEAGGSGLTHFDVYVSAEGGSFTPWLQRTTLRSAVFPGTAGARYAFYSVATDLAGNREEAPDTPDATTWASRSNAVPVLELPAVITLAEGGTVVITNLTTDADQPAQRLTFSLGPGAPSGAAIDPDTGVVTWSTGEANGPGTNQVTVIVRDNGMPSLGATNTVTVVVTELNTAPTLDPAADVAVAEGRLVTFRAGAVDADLPAQPLRFSLGPGAPAGAGIDPVTGVFTWRPADFQGGTTNQLTLVVTDDGAPALSASRAFTVVVRDTRPDFTLSVGTTNVFAGDGGRVALHLDAGAALTRVTVRLETDPERLTNLTLPFLAPAVHHVERSSTAPGRYELEFHSHPGAVLQGRFELAHLAFESLSAVHSAIVPLEAPALTGVVEDASSSLRGVACSGRVFIVAAEPLLDPWVAADGTRWLALYGLTGHGYGIQARADAAGTGDWTEILWARADAPRELIGPLPGTLPVVFYRAREVLITPLTIDRQIGEVLVAWPAGCAGCRLEESAMMGPGAVWSASSVVPVLQDGRYHLVLPVTEATRFFRLVRND